MKKKKANSFKRSTCGKDGPKKQKGKGRHRVERDQFLRGEGLGGEKTKGDVKDCRVSAAWGVKNGWGGKRTEKVYC